MKPLFIMLIIISSVILPTFALADSVVRENKYDEAELRASYLRYLSSLDVFQITESYPKAVRLLLSDSLEDQERALQILGQTAEPEAIPWIIPFLDNEKSGVRIFAALNIQRIVSAVNLKRRDPAILERVVLKPHGPSDPDLRPLAWLVLKLLRKPDDGNTHAYAATMIRYLELTEFEDDLLRLTRSRHPSVVNAAKSALRELGLSEESGYND